MEHSMDLLVGRKNEQEHLDAIMESRESEFVVVYGRRRVGKTFLVNNYFGDSYTFKYTGIAKKSKSEQLTNFSTALNRYADGKRYTKPRTWYEAFDDLRDVLENKKQSNKKRIIFIDELPWMDSRGSNLISALEHFWNDWAVTQNDLVLIVCGSATSWITGKILKNRGGLHNRVTQKLYIKPFTLHECREYLASRDIVMDNKDIAECYMIMGGIPYYLKQIRRGASLAQNIDEIFFQERGRLDDEFEALFASLFDKSDNYIKVVDALCKKRKGLTRDEILEATKQNSSGAFTKILKNLVDCDFIRFYKGLGKKTKDGLYQLVDPFTLFYYNYIKRYGTVDKAFWQSQIGTPRHNTWAGLAFEQLCLNHHRQIEKKLGISGVITQVFSWSAAKNSEEGGQIDLVIKREDRIINVCEMKFYDGPYLMKKKDYEDMQRRIRSFRSEHKECKTIHPVLVTIEGLKTNEYSKIFQNVVLLEDLFAE